MRAVTMAVHAHLHCGLSDRILVTRDEASFQRASKLRFPELRPPFQLLCVCFAVSRCDCFERFGDRRFLLLQEGTPEGQQQPETVGQNDVMQELRNSGSCAAGSCRRIAFSKAAFAYALCRIRSCNRSIMVSHSVKLCAEIYRRPRNVNGLVTLKTATAFPE